MRTKLFLYGFVLILSVFSAVAATNDLTATLQKGLFEEEANRNLEAAAQAYQTVSAQFDKDRALAATAIFRLGEIYRKQNKPNEAAAQYERIVREFADQGTLVTLSRQNLAGLQGPQKAILNQPSTSVLGGSVTLESMRTDLALLKAQLDEARKETNILRVMHLFSIPFSELSSFGGIDNQSRLQEIIVYQELRVRSLESAIAQLQNQNENNVSNAADKELLAKLNSLSIRERRDVLPGISNDKVLSELIQQLNAADLQFASLANNISENHPDYQRIVSTMKLLNEKIDARVQGIMKTIEIRAGAQGGVSPRAKFSNASDSTVTTVPDDEEAEIRRIQTLIRNSPDLINASGDNGTPLAKAAHNGWLKVVAYLLDHGAEVNGGGIPALNQAATAGNRAMVELLLSRGANVNSKGSLGKTPLHIAVEKKYPSVIEALLASKADVNARDTFGSTPLGLAAAGGQVKIARMLLEAGANLNVEDSTGRTPLSYAAGSGSPETVKILLEAKADPNAGKLNVPLLSAILNKNTASAELLLENGANPNARGTVDRMMSIGGSTFQKPSVTPLFLAITTEQLPMVSLLLKLKADPNDSQTDERPLLFSALSYPEILEALIDAGGKVEVTVPGVGSMLAAAISGPSVSAVDILLKRGANANMRNGDVTPLQIAVVKANVGAVSALLQHKAEVNAQNTMGKTALDLATAGMTGRIPYALLYASADINNSYETDKQKYQEIVDLLTKAGGRTNLPQFDHITVSRPSANFSQVVFQKDTNDWNQFTLLEAVMKFYTDRKILGNRGSPVAPYQALPFPDFGRLIIHRPSRASGGKEQEIKVNLLNSNNVVDCAKDLPVQPGDVIEIPERVHALNEAQTDPLQELEMIFSNAKAKSERARNFQEMITNETSAPVVRALKEEAEAKAIVENWACLRKATQLVVGGETKPLLVDSWKEGFLSQALRKPEAQAVLRSSSDLSRVKVTRQDAKTGKPVVLIVDVSANSKRNDDLWLRDGDVIEVPDKP